MHICIIYESKYGNGKKCVEYLRDVLRKGGHEVKLFSVRKTDPSSLPLSELYIFSAPTHAGNVVGRMKRLLRAVSIPKENAKYALITTCLNPPKTKSLKTMESILESKSVFRAADGLMIKVNGMKGPCESGYQEQLKAFANVVTAS